MISTQSTFFEQHLVAITGTAASGIGMNTTWQTVCGHLNVTPTCDGVTCDCVREIKSDQSKPTQSR